MRNFVVIFALFFTLFSCNSSKKYLEKGYYDHAIQKSVKKLRRKPTNSKEIAILAKAYRLANERDLEKIRSLKIEGQPDVWGEIFELYNKLKKRQELLKPLLPLYLNGRAVEFEQMDYTKEILHAKQRAADYFYAKGVKYMKQKELQAYRNAYYEFRKVKKYYKEFKDTEELMAEAAEKGISRVLLTISNDTYYRFSEGIYNNLLYNCTENARSEWVKYFPKPYFEDYDSFYDYAIFIRITSIEVSADQMTENSHTATRTVRDGWKYAFDANGNVQKDTLGNDIKEEAYKDISCKLIENQQYKEAQINGEISIYVNRSSELLRTIPFQANSYFSYTWSVAHGDLNALKQASRNKLKQNRPIPYPNEDDMINKAAEKLLPILQNKLYYNQNLLK